MGIDPASLTNDQLKQLAPGDRALVRTAASHLNPAPSDGAGLAKYLRRLERDEQKTLVSWLMLQEEAGKLTFDWSRTDRKTTNRKGMPDFRIYRQGRALLGEMKMDGGKLSPDQEQMREKFLRSGTEVQIWSSADVGIRATKNWLWTHWRMWQDEPISLVNE